MRIRKGDNVLVITGSNKGKTGKVARVFPTRDLVLVEGINLKKTFVRSKKNSKKEMVEKAFPMHISNVKKAK